MTKSEIEYAIEKGIEYKIETFYEEKENGEKIVRGRVKVPNEIPNPAAPESTAPEIVQAKLDYISMMQEG